MSAKLWAVVDAHQFQDYSGSKQFLTGTANASVQHVFISIKELITRVKVRWKLKYLLFSELMKLM